MPEETAVPAANDALTQDALSNVALAENTLAVAVFDLGAANPELFGTDAPDVLCAHQNGFAEQLTNLLAQNLSNAVVVRCGDASAVRYEPAGEDGAIVPVGDISASVEIYVPFLGAGNCAEAETIACAIVADLVGAAFASPFTPKPLTLESTSQGDTYVDERIRYHLYTLRLAFELILSGVEPQLAAD